MNLLSLRSRLRGMALGNVLSLAALATIVGFVVATDLRSPLKDDVAWLLYVAHRWLAGKQLYRDLIEVNPPLIVWLYAIPAQLADWLGVAPKTIAVPGFAAVMLASGWASARLLTGHDTLFARPIPVFAAISGVLMLLPGVEFGQREHLLIAAGLPYLCLSARDCAGVRTPPWVALGSGVVAGLGCALKPTYGVAFLLLEAWAVWQGARRPRAASVAAAVAVAVYAGSVLLWCPDFLARAVPLALALYGGTDVPLADVLYDGRVVLFGVAVVTGLLILRPPPRGGMLHATLATLVVFAIGAFIAFVLQGKNWFYHRLPATTATVLALLLWGWAWFKGALAPVSARNDLHRAALPALALLAMLAFVQADAARLWSWVGSAMEPDSSTEVQLERLLKHEHAHSYVAFSEWIALGFPVVNNTGVAWASRFDSMWALKGEMWRTRLDGAAPLAWPVGRWIAQDFVAGCPDIVVVDTRGGGAFIAALAHTSPAFARAWQQYHQIAAFDRLLVLRRDSPGCTPLMAAAGRM